MELRGCVEAAKAAQLKERERAAKGLAKAANALLSTAAQLGGALGSPEDEARAGLAQYLASLPQVRRPTSKAKCNRKGKWEISSHAVLCRLGGNADTLSLFLCVLASTISNATEFHTGVTAAFC